MDEPRMWGGGAHDRLDAMNTGHAGAFWFESSLVHHQFTAYLGHDADEPP